MSQPSDDLDDGTLVRIFKAAGTVEAPAALKDGLERRLAGLTRSGLARNRRAELRWALGAAAALLLAVAAWPFLHPSRGIVPGRTITLRHPTGHHDSHDSEGRSLLQLLQGADLVVAGEIQPKPGTPDSSFRIAKVMKGLAPDALTLVQRPVEAFACREAPDFQAAQGSWALLFLSDGKVPSAQGMCTFDTREACLTSCGWIAKYLDGSVAPLLAEKLLPSRRLLEESRNPSLKHFWDPYWIQEDLRILKDPAALPGLLAFVRCPREEHLAAIRKPYTWHPEDETERTEQFRQWEIQDALRTLTVMKDPRALALFREIADGEALGWGPEVRGQAILGLAGLKEAGELDVRYVALIQDPSAPMRLRADCMEAAVANRHPMALQALVAILQEAGNEKDLYELRWRAIEQLGRLGDPRALPILLDFLQNGNDSYGYRGTAAEALGALGDRTALPALIQALDDPGVAKYASRPKIEAAIRILNE